MDVGQEVLVREAVEQLVELLKAGPITTEHDEWLLVGRGLGPQSLAHQPTGVGQPVGGVEVKIDTGHARPFFANSTSRPTGRPVAPLLAPLFQAVPAMSR